MTTIDRRSMLKVVLGSAAAAGAGLPLIPHPAEAALTAFSKSPPAGTELPVEEAVFVTRRAGKRPRRPRQKCTVKNGKKHCVSSYHR